MKYFEGKNTGKGFITHEDNEVNQISGYPGEVWVTENWRWAHFRGLTELTKEEAQEKVDLALYGVDDENGNNLVITLP